MRPDWDEYFMTLAVVASTRATCDRRHVGCVIVDENNQIVATGYNGSLPGAPHCTDEGHLLFEGHCVRTTHAEANAIAQAASAGKSTSNCTIYVTTHPCPNCLKLLTASGVRLIVHLEAYHREEDEVSSVLAEQAHVSIVQYNGRALWESPIRSE